MKGNASCHLPSDSYRHNYNKTFGKHEELTGVSACAICGDPVPAEESICANCKLLQPQGFEWRRD